MNVPSKTSLTLLAKVQAGDEDAWRSFFDIYSPLVFGRLRSRGLSEEDAKEVVQLIFTKVARSIGQFRRDRPGDSFLKWLQKITSNQLADFRKHCSRRISAKSGSTAQAQLAETPDPFADEDWSTDDSARLAVLIRALEVMKSHFEEKTWRAFWLLTVEEKEMDCVCSELKMKPGTARQAKSKVRKRLKEQLEDVLDFD